MDTQIDAFVETQFPQQPYKAGFWLIATFPLAILVAYTLEMLAHRQGQQNMISFSMLLIVLWGTAYQWANALVKRSGLDASPNIGIAAAIALSLTILGMLEGFDLIFGGVLKVMNIVKTVGGTRQEFLVIFVIWTGIVTGGGGCAVGLALKRPKVALKLLGLGLVSGAVTFLVVALAMEVIGFRVGTPRPDGLPSMPIVTLLGIWSTALIGSELFGQVLARSKSTAS